MFKVRFKHKDRSRVGDRKRVKVRVMTASLIWVIKFQKFNLGDLNKGY